MTPSDDFGLNAGDAKLQESMIRLEAKIDVVLSRHEGKLDDLQRRVGEHGETLREHDTRVTANALTTSETRTLITQVQAEITRMQNDNRGKVATYAAWAAVAVSLFVAIMEPILQTLLKGG